MEKRSKLIVTRGEEGEGYQGKEREVSSQGTCIKDLWQWTTGWGLTEGVEGAWGSREQGEGNWDNYN